MKQPLTFYLSILCFLLTACGGQTADPKTDGQQSLMELSRRELATALEERDQLLAIIRDMSATMEQIKRMENTMSMAGAVAAENPDERSRILSDMEIVRQKLACRRRQLAELEARMNESALYTDDLRDIVSNLRQQIDNQNREIDTLRGRLSVADETIRSLNIEVDSLTTAVAVVSQDRDSAHSASERYETELNTCYYVWATKAELKKHHILETSFLKKSTLMKGDFDRTFFTTGDKRNLSSIDLHCRKAKILTNHPDGSYKITETDNRKVLVILDNDRFWSLTNYLVVQTD